MAAPAAGASARTISLDTISSAFASVETDVDGSTIIDLGVPIPGPVDGPFLVRDDSEGLSEVGLLRFDLSGIPDSATITGASFTFETFAVSFGNVPVEIRATALSADGAFTEADVTDRGTPVLFDSIPLILTDPDADFDTAPAFSAVPACDICTFAFDDVAPLQAALVGDLLELRLEIPGEDFFNGPFFAEFNTGFSGEEPVARPLTIAFDVAPIPLPATAPLLLAGLGGLLALRRRRN
jgi:hypothetical protein